VVPDDSSMIAQRMVPLIIWRQRVAASGTAAAYLDWFSSIQRCLIAKQHGIITLGPLCGNNAARRPSAAAVAPDILFISISRSQKCRVLYLNNNRVLDGLYLRRMAYVSWHYNSEK